MTAPISVSLYGFAHGGEAVGRLDDGRVVFVAYAIPGETVMVTLTEEHPRWCRARLIDVVEPSPDRVVAPCPYFGVNQCGGCKLQHIAPARQRDLLRQVVVDQLERLGRLPDPPVGEVVPAGDYGYRNRARFGVTATGSLGYRQSASHDVLSIDRCLLLDEPTQRLREQAGNSFAGAAEVEVRTAATGAAVVVDPGPQQSVILAEPMTETICGVTYEVSPSSFFQSNRAGAEILVDLVTRAAGATAGKTLLDLYAGVGLFAKPLAAAGAAVTAVEGAAPSAADARRNLGDAATVLHAPVRSVLRGFRRERRSFDIVVLDPPRQGAGKDVIEMVSAVAGRTIIVVACDPAALGRDAGILARAGWQLIGATPVDQFAQTGHIETVAEFRRDPAADTATGPAR